MWQNRHYLVPSRVSGLFLPFHILMIKRKVLTIKTWTLQHAQLLIAFMRTLLERRFGAGAHKSVSLTFDDVWYSKIARVNHLPACFRHLSRLVNRKCCKSASKGCLVCRKFVCNITETVVDYFEFSNFKIFKRQIWTAFQACTSNPRTKLCV